MEQRKFYGTYETAFILKHAYQQFVISDSTEYRYSVTPIFTCLATKLHSLI